MYSQTQMFQMDTVTFYLKRTSWNAFFLAPLSNSLSKTSFLLVVGGKGFGLWIGMGVTAEDAVWFEFALCRLSPWSEFRLVS